MLGLFWQNSFFTSSLTDSYNIFTLKMESASKNTILDLKMTLKSGVEKNIFEIEFVFFIADSILRTC